MAPSVPEEQAPGAVPDPGGPRRENLRRLLSPRSVAFLGGRDAQRAMEECIDIGFSGEIWFVNPRRSEVAGRPCFADVASLPRAPDAAFVAVPREASIEVVRALAARGTGGCVAYAAGFAESGARGRDLQRALVAAAGETALIGPNCYGVLNYLDRVSLWPDEHGGTAVSDGVAFVSQSGNISLTVSCQQRSLPLAYVISTGNQAMLGPAQIIEALIEDPRVRAIGLYIEGLDDIAAFSRAAAAALARGVPLVALKAGHSEAGARLALSHTSSLAGSDTLYRALFDRLGLIRAGSLAGMLETLKLLTVCGPLPGNRLVSLSCSGGEAALVADAGPRFGLQFPAFSPRQEQSLRAGLPEFVAITNPFDYNTSIWGRRDELERCFSTALEGEVDAALVVLDYPAAGDCEVRDWDTVLDAFIAAHRRTGTPALVVSTLSELFPRTARERAMAAGVVPLQGFDEALAAIGAAAWYGARRARFLADPDPGRLWVGGGGPALRAGRLLGEADAKRRLAEYGLRVPGGRLVDPAGAADAAAALGFPVVVKAAGAPLAHKTELGAVAVGLDSPEAVADAVERIRAAVARVPGAGDRVLVEPMVEGTVAELIIGVTRDPHFGPVLVVGAGGVLVELVEDSCTLLLPLDREAVAEALDSLRVARLLEGFRGRGPADREAAVGAVLSVARFAEAHRGRLLELDVNPLLVLGAGRGAVAVDALIRMVE